MKGDSQVLINYLTDAKFPPNNGAMVMISQIMKAFMSSAAKGELGVLLFNTRKAMYMWKLFE